MARPKKHEEKGAHQRIGLRITPALRQRLETIAEMHGLTLSDAAVRALEQYADREEDALYR